MSRLAEALAPVLHHFGYRHRITAEREILAMVPIEDLSAADRAHLSPIVGVLRNVPVLVLDLHGDRAADAEGQLTGLRQPIVVVFHGKGGGVLADVVDEFAARSDRYRVAGRSGATLDDPRHGMTLLLDRQLADRIESETAPRRDPFAAAMLALTLGVIAVVAAFSPGAAAMLAVFAFVLALFRLAPSRTKGRRRSRRPQVVRKRR